MKDFVKGRLAALLLVAVLAPWHAEAETVGTLTLDGLSYVSFQDHQVLSLAGSTIRFHFGTSQGDGSIPFTIAPSDVSIPEMSLTGNQKLRYALASPTSGTLRPSATGLIVELNATVSATIVGADHQGSFTYAVPFTTETASATKGGETIRVTGLRVVPAARYTQLVGATVNRSNAVPQPGTAVYTVLSGTFDRLP